MARGLEQIRKDLETLEQSTLQLNEELYSLYAKYLEMLGAAIRQQLVMAAYHLCTQTYPEAFLALSVSQREKLQIALQQLGDQAQSQLKALIQSADDASSDSEATATEIGRSTAASEDTASEDTATLNTFTDAAMSRTGDDDAAPVGQTTPDGTMAASATSPLVLARRHVLLERQIRALLQTLSNTANYLLKQADILPDLPEAVLTAVSEAEGGDGGPATPNLLNVLVEMGRDRGYSADPEDEDNERDEDDEDDGKPDLGESDRSMTHLMAINLRLADIEFTDKQTALWRSKIQAALARLKKLSSHYQKAQREKAQAEAEAAWRATWSDRR